MYHEYLMQIQAIWSKMSGWDPHRGEGISRPSLWAHQPSQATTILVKHSQINLHP
jgi:hypothetical protein